jgi:hypothetical protein
VKPPARIANLAYWVTGTEGSNPSLSANESSASGFHEDHERSALKSFRGFFANSIIAFVAIIIWQAPGTAKATLGGSADSVGADQRAFGGQMLTLQQSEAPVGSQSLHQQPPGASKPSYTVEQISMPDGELVKEYLSEDGTVFGVSWRGPRPPDLSQLLGTYFSEYQKAAASSQGGRNHLVARSGDLVLESGGHMRDLRGRAYLQSLLPPGFDADEIQ